MAAEWYYTTNKQQMGPVSWDELRQLATQGLLRPNDLVWTDGMPEWVKANGQAGLFRQADPRSSGPPRVELVEPPPPPVSPTRRRIDEEMDQQERDDRRDRRGDRQGGGGLRIGLTVGGIFVGLILILVCLGVPIAGVIIWLVTDAPSTNQAYTAVIGPNGHSDRTIRAKAGQRIQVDATAPNGFPAPRLGVQVLRNGNTIVNPAFIGANPTVTWTAPASDRYVVRIVNRGGNVVECNVRITYQ